MIALAPSIWEADPNNASGEYAQGHDYAAIFTHRSSDNLSDTLYCNSEISRVNCSVWRLVATGFF